jgi:hypothetical protein
MTTDKRVATLQARAARQGLMLTKSKSGFSLRTETNFCVVKTRALSRIDTELARREAARLELKGTV